MDVFLVSRRFEEHLLLLLKQKRRVEATVLLRRLAHYDRNPPHLAASLLGRGGRGRGHVACIPAWYQELSAAAPLSSHASGGDGGDGSGVDLDGIEEVVDLAEDEADVVECYDDEPLDCLMMRVVKQEPGLEEEVAAAEAQAGLGNGVSRIGGTGTGVGMIGDHQRSSDAAAASTMVSTATRVKMEVG